MAEVIGVECTLTIAGTSVPALLRGSSAAFQYAARPILSSGPPVDGAQQSLKGYAPSTGARSGVQVSFQVPYSSTGFLIAALAPGGVSVALGFGAAGGLSVASCICESLEVRGSEGGDIEGAATFQSVHLPTSGGGGSPTAADFFKFNDVANFTGAASHDDVSSFTWRVQRQLAAYRGNSANGIPKKLKVARQEVTLDGEYLKTSEAEGTNMVTIPVPLVTASVTLGHNPLYGSASGEALTLSCLDAFADAYPTAQGDFETFLTERISFKSTTGKYA